MGNAEYMGTQTHNMFESFFGKIAKAQTWIAVVSVLVCITVLAFTFVQMTNDDTSVCWKSTKQFDFSEYFNPYCVSYGEGEWHQCGWPTANTVYRMSIGMCLALTSVVDVLMRTSVISNHWRSFLTLGYCLWAILMFSVFCVDCSSIRVGAGACSGLLGKNRSCSSGRFIGLAMGDLALSALAYVLYKTQQSTDQAAYADANALILSH